MCRMPHGSMIKNLLCLVMRSGCIHGISSSGTNANFETEHRNFERDKDLLKEKAVNFKQQHCWMSCIEYWSRKASVKRDVFLKCQC